MQDPVAEGKSVIVKLSYDGLRDVLTRRAASAHVEVPTLHDFRRAFALAMLRNGTDVYTLAKLMGHERISVLQRYLKQTNLDTEEAHHRAGPVDTAGFKNQHEKGDVAMDYFCPGIIFVVMMIPGFRNGSGKNSNEWRRGLDEGG